MSDPALTYAQRELVWGISSEVAVLTSLAQRIDDHVRAVNAGRSALADRLAVLDALRAAAQQAELSAWLDDATRAPLPAVVERWPDGRQRAC